ncbi:MAG: ABC transporter substrate-binding protein [Acidobacteriota bacterium]|nr:ABC transporter substrate-binding protein [Acidobacteriota bacterium]
MKTLRKHLAAGVLTLALAVTTALSGCGSGSEPEPATTPDAAEIIDVMSVYRPETLAFGAPLAGFGDQGALDEYVNAVEIGTWSDVEQVKSLLQKDQAQLAATPAYVAANLYNKGVDVRLIAPVVWGMIFVLGPDGAPVGDPESLKGKKVGVAMPGNMPDLVFQYVMKQNGIEPAADMEIVGVEDARQIVQMLAQGDIEYAVVHEHLATLATIKAGEAGRPLTRVLDLQQEWGEITGGEARFPMAGVVMPGALVDSKPELVGAVLDELEASAAKANALDPETIAALAAEYDLPEAVITQVIPRLQVDVVPAEQARAEYEDFLTRIGEVNPKIYGEALPSDTFYAHDPR